VEVAMGFSSKINRTLLNRLNKQT